MNIPLPSVRFAKSFDGTRIAYAVNGRGPVVLRMPHWMTHLEHDVVSPLARHWHAAVADRHTLVRFDMRGCGLSDREVQDISFEACLRDAEAVAAAAGLQRCAVFGTSGGGMMAIALAERHPDWVTHLVLHGTACRGRLRRDPTPEQADRARLLEHIVELGWGSDEPAFRQFFCSMFMPGATAEQWRWWSERMRLSAPPANAARILRMWNALDVSELAARVRCPTLVTHSLRDTVQPYEEGRRTAALIPGAGFVGLASDNHVPLADEPAWAVFVAALRDFLPRRESPPAANATRGGPAAWDELTMREREVLDLIATGQSNAGIAAGLGVSVKTVGNHITRIFAKVGASSRAQAIVMSRQAGYGQGRPPR